jgi:transposase
MAPGNRKAPTRAKSSESDFSIMEFARMFPDDETCLRYLWNTRFNLGDDAAHCQRCEEIRLFRRYEGKQQRQAWTCTACGYQVYPTAGTIFHKSSTALQLWFHAMYLMTSTRCGISAKQLERELGVTYKTAWRMFTLIRNELMTQDDIPLSGTVEMDETFMGGKLRQTEKAKYQHLPTKPERVRAARKASDKKKVPVFGMAERQGKVAAYVVPSIQAKTLAPHIARKVEPGSVVYTDDGAAYRGMTADGWDHQAVNHSANVYVAGNVHTQTIDGFWSLVKRGISGTHHAVSPKWLQGYLNEYVWRYNHRDDGRAMFALLLLRSANPTR